MSKISGLKEGYPSTLQFDPETCAWRLVDNIGRDWRRQETVIASGSYLSNPALDVRFFAGMDILIPGAWTSGTMANLGIWMASTPTGGFFPMRDDTGTLLQCTGLVTGSWDFVPSKTWPGLYVKFRSETAAGVAVPQGGSRLLVVVMKG